MSTSGRGGVTYEDKVDGVMAWKRACDMERKMDKKEKERKINGEEVKRI